MTYERYEAILRAVLDDEIKTAESLVLLGQIPEAVVMYLRGRRRVGNSGRVPKAFQGEGGQIVDLSGYEAEEFEVTIKGIAEKRAECEQFAAELGAQVEIQEDDR